MNNIKDKVFYNNSYKHTYRQTNLYLLCHSIAFSGNIAVQAGGLHQGAAVPFLYLCY